MFDPGCPDLDLLQRFLSGGVPDQDEAITGHVESCRACQGQLDRLVHAPDLPLTPHAEPVPLASEIPFLRHLRAHQGAHLSPRLPPGGPAPAPDLPDYEVLEELGRGGMGIVYRARHRLLGRVVAIKMIQAGHYSTQADRERFHLEAQTVARLQDPHIVQLFEVGEWDGRPYLVLEYVSGGTLQQKLASQPQPAHPSAGLVEILARAVQLAHQHQVIHRDLKPANVLLAPEPGFAYGVPKLSDFGLAKRLDLSAGPLTQTLSGTPSYMAPEQVPDLATGRGGQVTPATDVYALGVILYEMLTGRPPFLGMDWMTTLWQVVQREPVPPRELQPTVPRDLETIVLKCLHKDPAARYPSALALAEDLRRFLDGKPILARPVGLVGRVVRWVRRRPVQAALSGLGVLAVAMTLVALSVSLLAVSLQQEGERRARDQEAWLRAQAEQSLYFSRISQAQLLWRDNDLARARGILEVCPPQLRGWEWRYLWGLCHNGLLDLHHPIEGPVHAVAVSERWIATLVSPHLRLPPDGGDLLFLWNAEDGTSLGYRHLPHVGRPTRLTFSADGARLVTVGPAPTRGERETEARVVSVWDLRELADTGRLPEGPRAVIPVGPIHSLAGTTRLAAVRPEEPTRVCLWDLEKEGGPHARLGFEGALASLALSEDGNRLLTCTAKGDWRTQEVATGRRLAHWNAPVATSACLSPDGHRVAVFEGGRLRLRDAQSGALQATLPEAVGGPTFSRDGRFLLAPCGDGVRYWDLTAQKGSHLIGSEGEREVGIPAVALGPDGQMAATATAGGAVRLWDLTTGGSLDNDRSIYRGHGGEVRGLAFSPEGRRLASGGADGVVRVWDLTSAQRYRVLSLTPPFPPGRHAGGSPFFGGLNDRLGVVRGRRVEWYEVGTGRLHATCPLEHQPEKVVVAGNGQALLMAAAKANSAELLEADPLGNFRPVHTLPAGQGTIRALAISQDGHYLALGTESGLRIWDRTGRLVHEAEVPEGPTTALAFDQSGSLLAWAAGEGPVRVLEATTGRLAVRLPNAYQVAFTSLMFHPQGERLGGLAGEAGLTCVWDLTPPRVLWAENARSRLTGMAYSPDGQRIALVSETGDLLLRTERVGVEVLRLPHIRLPGAEGQGVPGGPAFSADGTRLAVDTGAGHLVLWSAPNHPEGARIAQRQEAEGRAAQWHADRLEAGKQYPTAAEFHKRHLRTGR